jgi:hypothetical protein
MADNTRRQRVQRLRQSRKERGDRQMNLWLSGPIGAALDVAVESGAYPSRQVAVTHALETVFIRKEAKTVT